MMYDRVCVNNGRQGLIYMVKSIGSRTELRMTGYVVSIFFVDHTMLVYVVCYVSLIAIVCMYCLTSSRNAFFGHYCNIL